MPARKPAKKAPAKPKPIRPLYGIPIREAIARGDAKEMKALAPKARKYVSEVEAALAALEKAIAKAG